MLNKPALLKQLQNLNISLFSGAHQEIKIALESFARICANPLFKYQIKTISTQWTTPEWIGNLNDIIPIDDISHYCVLGVDGSQIYPDRHQGNSCFLINIGTVCIFYGSQMERPVQLDSVPFIFGFEDLGQLPFGVDLVDAKRQELEFESALNHCLKIKKENTINTSLFLLDGSLIFWHLENKEKALKDYFLKKYIFLLNEFYEQKILCAGYISLPKNKELINIIRAELTVHTNGQNAPEIKQVIDTHIIASFLKPYTRSTIFKSAVGISKEYPDHLAPHFFYMHGEQEMIRVEIPAWIAQDQGLVNQAAAIIANQIKKGRGYPVVLAEAHEQAVVKNADREFFYHLIQKIAFEQKQIIVNSQKSIKKRGIGI